MKWIDGGGPRHGVMTYFAIMAGLVVAACIALLERCA